MPKIIIAALKASSSTLVEKRDQLASDIIELNAQLALLDAQLAGAPKAFAVSRGSEFAIFEAAMAFPDVPEPVAAEEPPYAYTEPIVEAPVEAPIEVLP
jgi:hypothetical protein